MGQQGKRRGAPESRKAVREAVFTVDDTTGLGCSQGLADKGDTRDRAGGYEPAGQGLSEKLMVPEVILVSMLGWSKGDRSGASLNGM